MELRHLRYFIAVAEEGSLTVAAEKRLNTAQPSLSRQMRDLEHQVGVPLMNRSARGVELTAAGRAFLDHARLALTQAEAAGGGGPPFPRPGAARAPPGGGGGGRGAAGRRASQAGLRARLPNRNGD